jgi:hypothetical protein
MSGRGQLFSVKNRMLAQTLIWPLTKRALGLAALGGKMLGVRVFQTSFNPPQWPLRGGFLLASRDWGSDVSAHAGDAAMAQVPWFTNFDPETAQLWERLTTKQSHDF